MYVRFLLVDESEADNAKWVWVKNSKTAFPFVGQRRELGYKRILTVDWELFMICYNDSKE